MTSKIGDIAGTVEALNDLPVGTILCDYRHLSDTDVRDIPRYWMKLSPRIWKLYRYGSSTDSIVNVTNESGKASNLAHWKIRSLGPFMYVITEEPEIGDAT